MGFTVTVMLGTAIAIKAGKNTRTSVFLDLRALAAARPGDRAKLLREGADRGQLPERVAAALSAATDEGSLAAALRPIVDERGSPGGQRALPGTPLLQPTDERRRTGSHYTPRSLTEPIVLHALAPAFERIGPDAEPEAVLAPKICDPARGSGAFLVEAYRQLAARLAMAWARHPGTRPAIPPDEDEDLLARRLVAQRCLYGVDRNPMATDLARLSLWLATLARDHEFTFLDHALKTGDSLVGLARGQIGALTWGDGRQESLFGQLVAGRVAEALKAREEIREAPDDVERAVQEARYERLEKRIDDARRLADAIVGIFFAHGRPWAREAARRELEDLGGRHDLTLWARVAEFATSLRQGPHPLRPFHWEIEFPEAFAGAAPGFDSIVGNPPFAGKNTVTASNRPGYLAWLQTVHARLAADGSRGCPRQRRPRGALLPPCLHAPAPGRRLRPDRDQYDPPGRHPRHGPARDPRGGWHNHPRRAPPEVAGRGRRGRLDRPRPQGSGLWLGRAGRPSGRADHGVPVPQRRRCRPRPPRRQRGQELRRQLCARHGVHVRRHRPEGRSELTRRDAAAHREIPTLVTPDGSMLTAQPEG
jgi:hypothetical protein